MTTKKLYKVKTQTILYEVFEIEAESYDKALDIMMPTVYDGTDDYPIQVERVQWWHDHKSVLDEDDDHKGLFGISITEEEADKLLLTLDPLTAMATTDTDALLGLLEEAEFNNPALNDMLEALANGERHPMPDWSQYEPPEQAEIEAQAETMEGRFVTEQETSAMRMLDIVCPDCGSEFSVNEGELKNNFDVDS